MNQAMVYNPHDDVFTRWLHAQPRSAHRGSNGGTAAVNSAPKDTAALAEHFIGLPLRDLRAGWTACVIDAMASGVTLGAMARALTVVARRLYGVSVDPKTGQIIGDLDRPGEAPPPRGPGVPKSMKRKDAKGSPLTPDRVRAVRAMHKEGAARDAIAHFLGVPKNTVSRICNGNCFREVK